VVSRKLGAEGTKRNSPEEIGLDFLFSDQEEPDETRGGIVVTHS
jgi:hypothetical protein